MVFPLERKMFSSSGLLVQQKNPFKVVINIKEEMYIATYKIMSCYNNMYVCIYSLFGASWLGLKMITGS